MKKILAMIIAFVVSLSTNTEYSEVASKPYSGDYFTITGKETPDYRIFYGGTDTTTSASGCKITPYSAMGKKPSFSDAYWFINNQSVNVDQLNSYTSVKKDEAKKQTAYYYCSGIFSDGSYLIMPYTGKITCDTKSNDCTSIELVCTNNTTDVSYKIIIGNMKCWYCDVGRTGATDFSKDSDGNVINTLGGHTVDEFKDTSLPAGDVIGVTTSNTTIKVIPIKNQTDQSKLGTCTLYEFYTGTYTPYKN